MSNKKIYKYRKYGIKIIIGNPEAKFSVTSADEVTKNSRPESEIWHFRENESYFIDSKNVSINYIHQILNKKGNLNKHLVTIRIKNNDLIHKVSNLLGKKLDLSLAEQDRYPSSFDNINFSGSCLENYILGI